MPVIIMGMLFQGPLHSTANGSGIDPSGSLWVVEQLSWGEAPLPRVPPGPKGLCVPACLGPHTGSDYGPGPVYLLQSRVQQDYWVSWFSIARVRLSANGFMSFMRIRSSSRHCSSSKVSFLVIARSSLIVVIRRSFPGSFVFLWPVWD